MDHTASRQSPWKPEDVEMFKSHPKPSARPSYRGIGLYTHVEDSNGRPMSLPLARAKHSGHEPVVDITSQEIKAVWANLQKCLWEDDCVTRDTGEWTLAELKQRYGSLNQATNASGFLGSENLFQDQQRQQKPVMAEASHSRGRVADRRRMSFGDYVVHRATGSQSISADRDGPVQRSGGGAYGATGQRHDFEPSRSRSRWGN